MPPPPSRKQKGGTVKPQKRPVPSEWCESGSLPPQYRNCDVSDSGSEPDGNYDMFGGVSDSGGESDGSHDMFGDGYDSEANYDRDFRYDDTDDHRDPEHRADVEHWLLMHRTGRIKSRKCGINRSSGSGGSDGEGTESGDDEGPDWGMVREDRACERLEEEMRQLKIGMDGGGDASDGEDENTGRDEGSGNDWERATGSDGSDEDSRSDEDGGDVLEGATGAIPGTGFSEDHILTMLLDQEIAEVNRKAAELEAKMDPVDLALRRDRINTRREAALRGVARSRRYKQFEERTQAEPWLLEHVPAGVRTVEECVSHIVLDPDTHTLERHAGELQRLKKIPHREYCAFKGRLTYEHCECANHKYRWYPPLFERLSFSELIALDMWGCALKVVLQQQQEERQQEQEQERQQKQQQRQQQRQRQQQQRQRQLLQEQQQQQEQQLEQQRRERQLQQRERQLREQQQKQEQEQQQRIRQQLQQREQHAERSDFIHGLVRPFSNKRTAMKWASLVLKQEQLTKTGLSSSPPDLWKVTYSAENGVATPIFGVGCARSLGAMVYPDDYCHLHDWCEELNIKLK